jgi:hypothetical protein
MPKVHDRGGWPTDEPIDQSDHDLMDWERRVDAMRAVLGEKGYVGVDELRRAIEGLGKERYESLSYYERWAAGVEVLIVEKNLLTTEEIDRKTAQLDAERA